MKQKEQTFQHGLISKEIIVDIAKYKKIKAAYEKANKSIIELVDTTNELDPNCSLFGDILLDLDGVQSLLEMQEKLADMEKGFNREFMRLQKNKLIENQNALLNPPESNAQLEIIEGGDGSDDFLYEEAKTHVMSTRRASVSGLQRHFKIGYNRAVRIMQALEALGAVSVPDKDGVRKVIGEK
ncbi:winged helix-turn-helix DNA-binding domain protein [Vibrio phage 1.179.O._10N.286.45.F12]|nr:winged helix-turn-helix DNA-binding domain protein [Vibrio phage 1.179.O._10N.286.45.F12]